MHSGLPTRVPSVFAWRFGLIASAFVGVSLLGGASYAQSDVNPSSGTPAATTAAAQQKTQATKAHPHRHAKKKEEPPPPIVQAPPPPPPPDWPANDPPSPASVVWDANGLHINASNSSLQQILKEVSTETGTKVEGAISDRRVFGEYGPGHVGDVLAQLLQGSGYNFLLAGDIGQGTPREIVLSPRRPAGPNAANNGFRPPQQQADEDVADEPEDQPVQPPQAQQPPAQNNPRQGFGPNGPVRTPQQVMEEMQQRQQQLQQQQQQQSNPQ
jgi:hypothetical protein